MEQIILNRIKIDVYMVKRENILPFAPIGALIAENTNKRVAKDARITAANLLEDLTEKIMNKAILLAEHSGRKTIKAKDITLAFKQLGSNY